VDSFYISVLEGMVDGFGFSMAFGRIPDVGMFPLFIQSALKALLAVEKIRRK